MLQSLCRGINGCLLAARIRNTAMRHACCKHMAHCCRASCCCCCCSCCHRFRSCFLNAAAAAGTLACSTADWLFWVHMLCQRRQAATVVVHGPCCCCAMSLRPTAVRQSSMLAVGSRYSCRALKYILVLHAPGPAATAHLLVEHGLGLATIAGLLAVVTPLACGRAAAAAASMM